MALKKTLSLQNNFGDFQTIPDAIIEVNAVTAKTDRVTAYVDLKKSPESSVLEVRQYSFLAQENGPDFFKQAYSHLKTLPEFEGAVEV